MFQRLLIPLDGSQLSEAALEPARFIAGRLGASVTLLHVIEQSPPEEVHHQSHLQRPGQAVAYLGDVASRQFAAPLSAAAHVHETPVGNVARSIVEHAQSELQADLIIAATHGGAGARRLLFGSIAQQVAAEASVPLLLIRPGSPQFKLKRLLLPLDPDSAHDVILPFAEELARAFDAELELFSVVPTAATMGGEQAAAANLMPGTARAYLEMRAANAARDIEAHRAALQQAGIGATVSVARGDPVGEIVKKAEATSADLVVLTTHGRAGARAFWARSVAPRVVEKVFTAVLLFPLRRVG